MVIDIPFGFTSEILESNLDTYLTLGYVLAQSWVNNYSEDNKDFLFSRTNLHAGLKIDEEAQTSQIIMVFYNQPKELEAEEPEDAKFRSTKEVKNEGGNFMKPKDKNIKKTAKDMQVPRKYDNMRQLPMEVPLDVIKKLFLTIDQDIDDRLSVEEIRNYIRKVKLTIEETVADELFRE